MSDPIRRHVLKGLACAIGAAVLPGCSSPHAAAVPATLPGDSEAALSQLDAWLREQGRAHRKANLSMAVLEGERIVWSGGLGLADPRQGLAATAHTRYRAGSISKVLTAMAAMQLAERGLLDLDAPLEAALPTFRMRSRFASALRVTPRLIMCHRAGLPSDAMQGMWTDAPVSMLQQVALLRDEHLAFPPGALYAYSNVGFTLLGAAIEHLTGTPFERWMQSQWLDPLGMQASSFEIAPPAGPLAALALDAQGAVVQEHGLRDIAAGGLNTTVMDLLQVARLWFAQGCLQGRHFLSPDSMAQMQRPQHPEALVDVASVGLGWHLLTDELAGVGPLLWHSGGTQHHQAQLMLLPQLQLAVAVMSSADAAGEWPQEAALKALALMVGARTGADPVRPLPQEEDPAHPAAALSAYPGYYDTSLGVVRIDSDGRQAHVEMGKQLQFVPQPSGYVRLRYRFLGLFPVDLGTLGDMVFTPHSEPDGQVWLLARRKGRFVLAGTRLAPVPIPPSWQERLGRWRYQGGDPFLQTQVRDIDLREEAGLLLVEAEGEGGRMRLALAPVGDGEAVVRGLGRGRGATVRVTGEGRDTVLTYSGMRFVRLAGT